ncbi:MAG: hypothetical protein GXO02_02025 [Epsilonproteobacteria bacterium]|nr:hypothetical protein [Campylobacterota bacterium]
MKTIQDIFNNLKRQNIISSLSKYRCFNRFIKLLPAPYQKAIAFIYTKDNKLFIALSHPGYKMEFNYNKELLKNLLTQISLLDKRCNEIFKGINDIVIFISKLSYNLSETKEETIPYYFEKSKGEFKIELKDKDLAKILEEIKGLIKKNGKRRTS